ncbi:hypothetical protein QCA50_005924 [Cerrena zonata]|uniref:Uncharacterized protein n=1 Tax=Cerrena zonata TaxID=2478898 RepID=A0AAW0GBL1_9APHY
MSNVNARLVMRNRPGRTKVDENATSRHARQPSTARLSQTMVNVQALKTGLAQPRAALGEVTTAAVNRNKEVAKKPTGKEPIEVSLKRKSSSLANGPQRVPCPCYSCHDYSNDYYPCSATHSPPSRHRYS